MSFAWEQFFQSANVDYVMGPAPNVRPNHIGIDCPFCAEDTKKHFSINLNDDKVRGCWRDGDHWMPAVEVIARFGHVTFDAARVMLEAGEFPGEVKFDQLLNDLDGKESVAQPTKRLAWAREFLPFSESPGNSEEPFHDYLFDRGFDDPYGVARAYGLRWASRGDWKGRVAFPLRLEGKQVGWTARAIGRAKIRYRTHPPGDLVRHLVWNLEPGDEGDLLVLCEGPFDALKLDWYAPRGVTAVALLGLSVGPVKINRLAQATTGFRRTVLLLDRGAEGQAMDLAAQMSVLRPELAWCPEGTKDPGEMTASQTRELFRQLVEAC